MSKTQENKKPKSGIFLAGIGHDDKPYPAWRYHEFLEPIIVHNAAEDKKVQEKGWEKLDTPITGLQQITSWRYDLEDMTSKQLVLFAKEEFDVDLPLAATEEQLIKAMWRLTHFSPQHKGRITLLAQTIEMDYDKTCEEISNMSNGVGFEGIKETVESEEITI